MRIIYPYPEELPSKNARSIQALNTVCALAKYVPVYFFPSDFNDNVFRYYGLKKPEKLNIKKIKRKWGPFVWSGRYIKKLREEVEKPGEKRAPVFIYTRHIKLAYLLLKSKPKNARVIYEVHEIFSQKNPRIADVERYVFEHADGLTFISGGLRESVIEAIAREVPSCIIPSGVAIRQNALRKDTSSTCNEVFYVGSTRYEWKGIKVLLEAVSKLDGVRLNIVGEVNTKVKQLPAFESLKKRQRIKEWGYIPPVNVPDVLGRAIIGVLPTSDDKLISKKFTSPLKLLEYMAAGMAIVASDLPSTREIVNEEEALLVKPGNPDSLAEGIKKLIEDPELRNTLARNALVKAEQFSWERRAEKIVSFLEDLERMCR